MILGEESVTTLQRDSKLGESSKPNGPTKGGIGEKQDGTSVEEIFRRWNDYLRYDEGVYKKS